jgi:catechol 2,3-dioxygenase-like lactoylglutathione lyase family enzyme
VNYHLSIVKRDGWLRQREVFASNRAAYRPRRNKGGHSMIARLDHLVLTVANIGATIDFYAKALGMQPVTFGNGRHALAFGTSKINLHEAGKEFEPKALRPTPGSADLCFVTESPLSAVMERLSGLGITIEEGPVARTGATGPIDSLYVRDPDANLIEISNYR